MERNLMDCLWDLPYETDTLWMVSFWVPYEWFSLCTLWSVTLCCLMNDSPCVPYGRLPSVALWMILLMYLMERLPSVTLWDTFLMYLMKRLPTVIPMKQFSSCPYGKDSLWLYGTFKSLLISWCRGAFWIIVRKKRDCVLHFWFMESCRCDFHLPWFTGNHEVIFMTKPGETV